MPPAELRRPLISAVFQEERGGQLKTIGLVAKRARGLMARYVIRNRIDDAEALKDFAEDGYAYRPDVSEADRLVFAR